MSTNVTNDFPDKVTHGPGFLLKKTREELGFSIDDVVNRLHLTAQVIEDLEKDYYPRFSALVFIRGYLRAYAKLLNLSPEEIMQSFEKLGISENESKNSSEINFKPHREFTDQLVPWVMGASLVVIVAIAFMWGHVLHKPSEEITNAKLGIDNKSVEWTKTNIQNVTIKGEPNPMETVSSPPKLQTGSPTLGLSNSFSDPNSLKDRPTKLNKDSNKSSDVDSNNKKTLEPSNQSTIHPKTDGSIKKQAQHASNKPKKSDDSDLDSLF